MTENHFGDEVAAIYDASVADRFDQGILERTCDFLAGIAPTGRILEFGIGTGRVALPLAARGRAVAGIELSEAMVRELRAKPGGADLDVTIGDFATTRVAGEFSLVYLVFNTIMNLTTQDDQVRCFENAAAHLGRGGHFVVETVVPDLRRLPPGESANVFDVREGHIGVDEYEDLAEQRMRSHHVWVRDGQSTVDSQPFRFVWPSELDLMARLAGMERVARWADWDRVPFTSESRSHVSVWRTP